MPLNLLTLPASEAERLAYSEGFTCIAELFARIAELEADRDTLTQELEDLKDKAAEDSLTSWEKTTDPLMPINSSSRTASSGWLATIPPRLLLRTMTSP